MGRLAEHHASTTAEARKTLTGSWRKVRGKRWRALRTKLGELSDTAREANDGVPAQPTHPHDAAIAASSLEPVPEPEPRPIEH
jgi:plasmid stability protein